MASITPDLRLPSQPLSTATALWPVLISRPAEDKRLSWSEWLDTHPDGIPANVTNIKRLLQLKQNNAKQIQNNVLFQTL